MSMTREEAIKTFEEILQLSPTLDETGCSVTEAMKVALTALRPVSREKVEKVWRGGWVPYLDGEHIMPERYYRCSKCGDRGYMRKRNFCPYCGAPMTDKAVDIIMERMGKMHEIE